MMNDLIELLRKQSTPNLHLVDLFYSILDKEGPGVQSRRFGMSKVATGRRMIVKTIEQYAQSTQNWHMLRLLDRFRKRFPNPFVEPQRSRRRATGAGATQEIRPRLNDRISANDFDTLPKSRFLDQAGGSLFRSSL
jgi:hypothetical protein